MDYDVRWKLAKEDQILKVCLQMYCVRVKLTKRNPILSPVLIAAACQHHKEQLVTAAQELQALFCLHLAAGGS